MMAAGLTHPRARHRRAIDQNRGHKRKQKKDGPHTPSGKLTAGEKKRTWKKAKRLSKTKDKKTTKKIKRPTN